MAYTPKIWEGGEVITANALNDIEGGVASVNADFVPKTWACDDTITADELNRIEQGIANASGGGSSDFSTTQVTVVGQLSEHDTFSVPSIVEAGTAGAPIPYISAHSPGGATVFTVPLYKGHAMLSAPDYEVSGNIVKHNEGDWIWYDITGDCTITIS